METNKMNEQLLDLAACEALSANTPAESAAYQQELASAGDAAQATDRGLRETVARLAAASPHMAPPPDLRGRILQATAPVTFRMEDYRKATRDNSRFYKYAFYAAMAVLMAAAGFNMHARNETSKIATALKQRDSALAAFINPESRQIRVQNDKGELIGVALANQKTHDAVLFLADKSLPPGQAGQIVIKENGKDVAYNTLNIAAPGEFLKPSKEMPTIVTLFNEGPSEQNSIRNAAMGK